MSKKAGKKAKAPAAAAPKKLATLAEHPRAAASVRRTKAMGGLAAFAAACLGSYAHGEPLAGALERGLVGGVVGYMVAWMAAVAIWRQLVLAEIRAAYLRKAAGRQQSEQ